MKKILFFTISTLLIASVFVGCSKDDDKGNPQALIGTWEVVGVTVSSNGVEISMDIDDNEIITFNADGTFISTEDGIGTYTTKGWSLSYTYVDKDGNTQVMAEGATITEIDEDTGLEVTIKIKKLTYSVSGENLTLTVEAEGTIMGMKITTVTKARYKKVN